MKRKNIYNKVKTLALTALVALLAATPLTSCSDFLEVEPQNVITEEQFWNQETDVENIIAGCYTQLDSYNVLSRMMIWGEFRSENVINNGTIENDVNLERLLKENIMANNGYTTWVDFYYVINTCNTVILKAPQVAAVDPSYTQSELNSDIAEVTALRCLCYFYLIRTFRDVPYTEEPFLDDSQDLALPQTSFEEVLAACINSLEAVKDNAITAYPTNVSGLAQYYNTGRVTRDFIYALLCEMYLWQENYEKCIEYADLIIEHKKEVAEDEKWTASDFENSNGYPLVPDAYRGSQNLYGRSFTTVFLEGNSMESIFELNFDKSGGTNTISNEPACYFFGGGTRTPYVTYTTYVGQDMEDDLGRVFDANNNQQDVRSYAYMNTSRSIINKYSASNSTFYVQGTFGSYTFQYPDLWPTEGSSQTSLNKSNYIIYRLSDIMLLKAEALTQLMTDDAESLSEQDVNYRNQAFDLINAVNKRSLMQSTPRDTLVMTDYATKSAITDLVYEERERELMFEGKRFFDLVRRSRRDGNTDYLRDNVGNKSVDLRSIIASKMAKMDGIYWPINLDEMKANPNLKQNSAFGSGENSSYTAN